MTQNTDATDLIHREIDRENTSEQSAEFQRRIVEDAQFRAGYEKLQTLSRTLEAIGQEEPPTGLVADVMRALRVRGEGRGRWLETWRSAFAKRPAVGYGLSLAAGIVLGALGFGALDPSALNIRDEAAVATILPPGRLGTFREVDRQELASEGLRGEAVARRGVQTVQAEVRVESRQPVLITVEFDAKALSPLGFGRSVAAEGDVVLEPGRVRIAHSGAGTYQVFLGAKSPGPAHLTLKVAGEGILIERTLRTGGGE